MKCALLILLEFFTVVAGVYFLSEWRFEEKIFFKKECHAGVSAGFFHI